MNLKSTVPSPFTMNVSGGAVTPQSIDRRPVGSDTTPMKGSPSSVR